MRIALLASKFLTWVSQVSYLIWNSIQFFWKKLVKNWLYVRETIPIDIFKAVTSAESGWQEDVKRKYRSISLSCATSKETTWPSCSWYPTSFLIFFLAIILITDNFNNMLDNLENNKRETKNMFTIYRSRVYLGFFLVHLYSFVVRWPCLLNIRYVDST